MIQLFSDDIIGDACGLDLSDKESYNFIKDCGIALSWSPSF